MKALIRSDAYGKLMWCSTVEDDDASQSATDQTLNEGEVVFTVDVENFRQALTSEFEEDGADGQDGSDED